MRKNWHPMLQDFDVLPSNLTEDEVMHAEDLATEIVMKDIDTNDQQLEQAIRMMAMEEGFQQLKNDPTEDFNAFVNKLVMRLESHHQKRFDAYKHVKVELVEPVQATVIEDMTAMNYLDKYNVEYDSKLMSSLVQESEKVGHEIRKKFPYETEQQFTTHL